MIYPKLGDLKIMRKGKKKLLKMVSNSLLTISGRLSHESGLLWFVFYNKLSWKLNIVDRVKESSIALSTRNKIMRAKMRPETKYDLLDLYGGGQTYPDK